MAPMIKKNIRTYSVLTLCLGFSAHSGSTVDPGKLADQQAIGGVAGGGNTFEAIDFVDRAEKIQAALARLPRERQPISATALLQLIVSTDFISESGPLTWKDPKTGQRRRVDAYYDPRSKPPSFHFDGDKYAAEKDPMARFRMVYHELKHAFGMESENQQEWKELLAVLDAEKKPFLDWTEKSPASTPRAIKIVRGEKYPIYVGTDVPALYPIEKETFIPIEVSDRVFYVRPNGLLTQECMANLETPFSVSFWTTDLNLMPAPMLINMLSQQIAFQTSSIIPGTYGSSLSSGFEQAEDKSKRDALINLRHYLAFTKGALDGTPFEVVPIGFDIRTGSSASSNDYIGSWARMTVHYVLLNHDCSNVVSQVRERLLELRNALASADEPGKPFVTEAEIERKTPTPPGVEITESARIGVPSVVFDRALQQLPKHKAE